MQIVIELDEKTYNDIKEGKIYSSLRDVPLESVSAIRRGTVLPKGHGRLIDADMVAEDMDTERVNLFMDGLKGTPRGREHLNDLRRIMDEIPTIIEADKEGQSDADSN